MPKPQCCFPLIRCLTCLIILSRAQHSCEDSKGWSASIYGRGLLGLRRICFFQYWYLRGAKVADRNRAHRYNSQTRTSARERAMDFNVPVQMRGQFLSQLEQIPLTAFDPALGMVEKSSDLYWESKDLLLRLAEIF